MLLPRSRTVGLHLARRQQRQLSHLRIVAVNDVYELHNLPRLRSLCLDKQREHSGVFLATLAGDFVSPSIISGLDGGQSMIDSMNGVRSRARSSSRALRARA